MGSLTVQAQYLGIAVHHIAGVDWQKAQKEFNVPEGYHISTAVALGHYGGDLEDLPEDSQEPQPPKRNRASREECAFKQTWKPQEKQSDNNERNHEDRSN